MTEVKEYFSEFNQNQPPFPENPISFIPFDLHVTETTDEKNQRIGRIQFIKDGGKVCYDATWDIEKKSNRK